MRRLRLTRMIFRDLNSGKDRVSSGKSYVFPENAKEIFIGRSPENYIMVSDPTVSRVHCRVIKDYDSYRVLDNESKHGTFVNGERIMGLGHILEDGNILSLGRTAFSVGIESAGIKDENRAGVNENGN